MSPESNTNLTESTTHYEALPVQPARIPAALTACPQWVCWRYGAQMAQGKRAKQPVNPHTLHSAGVHWANTWSTFERALTTYEAHCENGIDGIGFVLTVDDPFVGIDLDRCLTGSEVTEEASYIVEQMASYSEISPSGNGLRILVSCAGFQVNARTTQFELYSHSRFLTITGHHLAETPSMIAPASAEKLISLRPRRLGEGASALAKHAYATPQAEGMALWARIFARDRYGAQHARRFQGDLSLDRNDHSLAVIRLLNCAARWTDADPVRMRSLMLLSPLVNEKWFSKRGTGDWLDHQIADAIRYIDRGT